MNFKAKTSNFHFDLTLTLASGETLEHRVYSWTEMAEYIGEQLKANEVVLTMYYSSHYDLSFEFHDEDVNLTNHWNEMDAIRINTSKE